MDRIQLLNLAKVISPSSIRQYAIANGWLPVVGSRRKIWLFSHQIKTLSQIQIPIYKDDDSAEAFLSIAERISEVEQRPIETVLDDLIAPNSDVIRYRKVSDEIKGGSIPFDSAIALMNGAKQMLSAAACSVSNPVIHHARLDRIEARQLIQNARMGQTEIGSFILKILCPLDAISDTPLLIDLQPYTRMVTTLLMSSTEKLIRGIEDGNIDQILETQTHKGERPEITSNLCKGLMELRGEQDSGEIEISMRWAPSTQKPTTPVSSLIRIPIEYFPMIEKVHQELKPMPGKDTDQVMVATVETLNGDVGEDGKRCGEVILSVLLPDEEELIKARTDLTADDYEKAVIAHEKGRSYIKLRGQLKRGPRISRIDNPEGLMLVDDTR